MANSRRRSDRVEGIARRKNLLRKIGYKL